MQDAVCGGRSKSSIDIIYPPPFYNLRYHFRAVGICRDQENGHEGVGVSILAGTTGTTPAGRVA